MLGIGGGFLMVPALIYLFRVPTAVVVGHVAVPDPVHDGGGGDPARRHQPGRRHHPGDLLVIGGVFGAQFGARAGQNIRGHHFRLLLALIVLAVGVRFASEIVLPPDELFSLGQMEIRR